MHRVRARHRLLGRGSPAESRTEIWQSLSPRDDLVVAKPSPCPPSRCCHCRHRRFGRPIPGGCLLRVGDFQEFLGRVEHRARAPRCGSALLAANCVSCQSRLELKTKACRRPAAPVLTSSTSVCRLFPPVSLDLSTALQLSSPSLSCASHAERILTRVDSP